MDRELDPELHTIPPDRGAMENQPTWRRDFPINMAQDAYVARRDFTKFLGLTSPAFVVGQFWIALQSRWRKTADGLPVISIAKLDEVAVGSAIAFHYPAETDPAILLRTADDELLAYSSQCTHLLCPVLPDMENGGLHCPGHAGYFDLKSGRPLAGPPRRSLPHTILEVREGTIYAVGYEKEQA